LNRLHVGVTALTLALITTVGCSIKKNGATAPNFAVPNTPTNSYTPGALTSTPTHSFTRTYTVTNTPTPVNTPTGTLTPPTATSTSTATYTPTNTPTVTSTFTPCTAGAYAPAFDFDSNLQCWQLDWNPLPLAVVSAWDGAEGNPAAGSISLYVPFSGTGQQMVFADTFGSTPTDLTGKIATVNVRLYSGLNTSSANLGYVRLIVKSGSGYVYASSAPAYLDSSAPAWVPVTLNFDSPVVQNSGFLESQIVQFGVEIDTNTSGTFVPAVLHIDHFVVSSGPTYTPTNTLSPTLTPTITNTPPVGATATFTPTVTYTSTHTGTPTATFTATVTSAPCTQLVNGFETLTDNGTWAGANASRSIIDSSTAPVGSITQGTHCMEVNISTGSTWNQDILNWTGFAPFYWDAYTQLQADVYVDGNLVTGNGATYAQLQLKADSSTQGVYSRVDIASNHPDLVAGAQTVTWTLSYAAGSILPGSPLTTLYFTLGSDAANTGHIYIDNLRLVYGCAYPPPAYPAWNFDVNNQLWQASTGTLSHASGGYNGSAGAMDLHNTFLVGTSTDSDLTFTVDGGWNGGKLPFDFAGRSIRCWVKAPAAVVGNGTPQAYLVIQSNNFAGWDQSTTTNLVADTWTQVAFNPIVFGTPSNSTLVDKINLQIMMNTDGTTRGTGDILVDQVEVY